jgi:hypothetical protein
MSAQPSAKNFAVIVRLDRTIQYAAACVWISGAGDYWMPAFAGMTMRESRGRQ